MADRVSVTIRIGGALPKAALSAFLQAIESEALTNPLGEYFTASQITGDDPLDMGANDVAWGRLEELEAFCVEHHLPFERWCGSYPGSWEAGRIVFDGAVSRRSWPFSSRLAPACRRFASSISTRSGTMVDVSVRHRP